MTHACPAAHLGSEMWENEGNAYHVYMQLSFGRQFLFSIVFFFFLPIKHTNNNTSRLCFLLDHLFLSQTHTHTYTYIWKPELTLYDVSWSSGLFTKSTVVSWRNPLAASYRIEIHVALHVYLNQKPKVKIMTMID